MTMKNNDNNNNNNDDDNNDNSNNNDDNDNNNKYNIDTPNCPSRFCTRALRSRSTSIPILSNSGGKKKRTNNKQSTDE